MRLPHRIKLDIDQEYYNLIPAQQGDTARVLNFQILNNNIPFSLENKTVRARIKKPDGNVCYNDMEIINASEGECDLKLTNQILIKPGMCKVQLEIMENGEILSTIIFAIFIRESIDIKDAAESTNEFTALENGIIKLDEWDKYFKETSGTIEEKYTERLNGIASSLEESKTQINNNSLCTSFCEKLVKNITQLIVCYGDSTFWGFSPINNSLALNKQVENTFPKVLQQILQSEYGANVSVVNEGHSGWQTDEAVANFDDLVLSKKPNIGFIGFGINDCGGNSTYGEIVSITDYKKNLSTMVEKATKEGIEVILLTPNPITTSDNALNRRLKMYVRACIEVAKKYNIPYINMTEEIEKVLHSGSKGYRELMPDGMHWLDYSLMAQIIATKLMNGVNLLNNTFVIEGEGYIPLARNPYVETNYTTVENIVTKDYDLLTSTNKSLRFRFYNTNKNLSLYLVCSLNKSSGSSIKVKLNGAVVKSLNLYNPCNAVPNAKFKILESIPIGLNNITIDDIDNVGVGILSAFKIEKLKIDNSNKFGDSSDTINSSLLYKRLNEGKIAMDITNPQPNIVTFGEQIDCNVNNKLVVEYKAKLSDKTGLTFLSNKALQMYGDSATIRGNNSGGYLVLVSGSDLILCNFTYTNALNILKTVTDGLSGVTISNTNTYRIEYYNKQIDVYINDVLKLTHVITDNYLSYGQCGIFSNVASGKIELEECQYCLI